MFVTLKEVYVEGDPHADITLDVVNFKIHHDEIITNKFTASKSRWQWWTLYNTEGNHYDPEYGETTFGELVIEQEAY